MPDAEVGGRIASRRYGSCLFACALVLLLTLAGCATPRGDGFVDPAYREARYDGFLAYAAFTDLGPEAVFERRLCTRLRAEGHACTTMLAAAPPTREQTGASRHTAAVESGAEAVITIELADPNNIARRVLSAGGPAYEVSLIDNQTQRVVARLAIQGHPGLRSAQRRAATLADAVVVVLAEQSLLHSGL